MEPVEPVLPPRRAAESRSEMTELILPNDTNTLGNLKTGASGPKGAPRIAVVGAASLIGEAVVEELRARKFPRAGLIAGCKPREWPVVLKRGKCGREINLKLAEMQSGNRRSDQRLLSAVSALA